MPKSWYGMPALCQRRQGRVLLPECHQFDARYASFASTSRRTSTTAPCGRPPCAEGLTPAGEERIVALVKKASVETASPPVPAPDATRLSRGMEGFRPLYDSGRPDHLHGILPPSDIIISGNSRRTESEHPMTTHPTIPTATSPS
jgi:hypothetical protein